MRLVLISLVLVASASAFVEPLVGYHDAVGIPRAAELKAAEEAFLEKTNGSEQVEREGQRIVGGAVTNIASYPYMGGLVISFPNIVGVSACGSSLLSSNRLVTAAHCWFDGNRQANQFVVVLASQFLFSGGTRIPTSTVIMHPGWTPSTLANDVAMIYLPFNVIFSQAIQPISLPSGTQLQDTFVGQWAVAIGYGQTMDGVGVTTATQLSHVLLQVMQQPICEATFLEAIASNICTAGTGGVGICFGDSGGPLVVNQNGHNILVGISSFVARAGCQLGFPSVYARVTSFFPFIIQHL